MKNALDWIKSNPISAVSIVVAFLGFVVFMFVLFVKAPGLRGRVVEDNSKQASDLNSLSNARVEIPNSDPNEPPIELTNLVINEEIITFVQGVYEDVESQSSGIKNSTRNINSLAHERFTFVGGTVFGSASDPSPAQIVAASEDYRNSFDAMFMPGFESLNMPQIVVGTPPSLYEIEESVYQTLVDYLQSVGAQGTGDLTQQQAEVLHQLQRVAVIEILTERAGSIQLYAEALPLPEEEEEEGAAGASGPGGFGGFGGSGSVASATGMDRYSEAYPFEVAPWAFAAEQATLDELWEGQVQIWITRDIMQTIANVNSTSSQASDGSVALTALPVIEAPVKRLIALEIIPGYVGLHSGGGVNAVAGTARSGGSSGARPGGGSSNFGGGPFGAGGPDGPMPGGPGGPGLPGGGTTSQPATAEVEVSEVYGQPAITTLPKPAQPIIDSFFFGPTGRFSNSVFDVRHARLTLHIEWAKLPEFFDALRQVNFMTVIDFTCRDIDEYDALASGYVYGTQDVVEVELVIETLWYRSWTTGLMPQIVKDALLVEDEDPTQN